MDLITPKEAAGMLRVTMIDRPITRCSSQHYRLDRADVSALTEKTS